jgi:tripartite-type tricarboxylate transporter receptor subunit TctC
VPFTAGSTSDVIARAVTERLEKAFKQPCIVDNRPGAGGTVGASAVVAAPADGYTVLIHSAGHVANAALYPKLRYDTLADFTPVTMMASMPNVLVVSPAKGYTSVKDLVQKAKAGSGQVMYGSAGNGSGSHIAAEKFRLAAGLPPAHIPYRGAPEALNDVMGGRIDWFMSPIAVASSLISAGKLTPLAVGTTTRSTQLPNVPTTVESGYPESDYIFWIGMFVSAKTPPDVVARLHAETLTALQSEEVRARFGRLGAEPAAMPQKDFALLVTNEAATTAALIKKAGIRVE